MMDRVSKHQLVLRLREWLPQQAMFAVHPDEDEPTARATLECLAGLPPYEHVFVGDLNAQVAVLAVLSGERVPGSEVARRAHLLFERARVLAERRNGPVTALQLAVYEREVPKQERAFVLGN